MTDIVIVNYNSTDHLLNCLESVKKNLNGMSADIFVQDNASKDNVSRILSEFPDVILHINTRNLGFAKAVNQAIRQGKSEYLILLNPDTRITEDFFKTSLEFMRKNPDVGVMGPKISDNDGRLQNSARAFPTPLTAFFGRSSFLSKKFPQNPITSRNLLSLKSDGKTPMTVDWVSGACMVIRRKAIEDAGLLDERFFMYWEDADWCRRMWESGWKVVYYPRASVYHYVGGSSEKSVFRSVIEFHKSVYRLFEKYLDTSLSFFKPLVFGGLAVRIVFILMSHLLERLSDKLIRVPDMSFFKRSSSSDGRIKILRIISRLNIGGPAIHVCMLTNGLNPEKFESMLITGKISPQEGDMGYLFNAYPKKPMVVSELQREISFFTDIKAFLHIFRILMKEKPDIVDTHTAKAGTSARMAVIAYNLLRNKNIRMIHTFHGHVFEGYFSSINSLLFVYIERLLARSTDLIIAISRSQQHELSEKYHIAPREKIKTIELGFDLQPFLSCKQLKGQFRERLNIASETLLIGIIGRLVPIKNHLMFFMAAKQFIDRHPDKNIRFIVVGDGELRDELEDFCQLHGLAGHVNFCGWIKEVPQVYADLDILALTSLNEGTPFSIIESMAASVPVIATDVGGVSDLLGKSVDFLHHAGFSVCRQGILCPKNDAQSFAQGLAYLVSEDPVQQDMRVSRAREFAQAHFNHRRLFSDMESLYLDLMA